MRLSRHSSLVLYSHAMPTSTRVDPRIRSIEKCSVATLNAPTMLSLPSLDVIYVIYGKREKVVVRIRYDSVVHRTTRRDGMSFP